MTEGERDRKIVEMRKRGHTMTDIALELNCSWGVVRRVLDTKHMTRQEERELRKKHICDLRDQGHSVSEICTLMKVGRAYVYEVLKYHRG